MTEVSRAAAELVVRNAYLLILGRVPDPIGSAGFVRAIERGDLSANQLYAALATSEEFSDRAARVAPPAWPDRRAAIPEGSVDVRELIASAPVEAHNAKADEYFVTHKPEIDHLLSMPFANVEEATAQLSAVAQLLAVLRPLPGMRILDFGAGSCWLTRILAQMHCHVVACDASRMALHFGEQLFQTLPPVGDTPPPTFLPFDGRRIEVEDNSIDRVICMDAFHHVPNQSEVLSEWFRILVDGGIVGLGEPGPQHSLNPQSQHEMHHYSVIENDVLMSEILPMAESIGFRQLKLAVPPGPPAVLLGAEEYLNTVPSGFFPAAYVQGLQGISMSNYRIFLFKGEPALADSRDRQGLACELEIELDQNQVRSGQPIAGRFRARNTGVNQWRYMPGEWGSVEIGVHLVGAEGEVLDYLFYPLNFDTPTMPGDRIEGTFTIDGPPPGRYELRFDLDARNVTWFATNGGTTVNLDFTVG